jgi:zinc transport system substrate-binding protein
VVYQSGFQPAVDTAVTQAEPKRVVDSASFLTLLRTSADGAETAATAGAGYDPHTWLDPTNLIAVAEHVRDALSAARPEQAAAFAANTRQLVADLTGLDSEIKADLTGCRVTPFITSHAAFGYLAARYGLTQVGISGLEPDVEPGAGRIAEVQQIARANNVTTIFFETLVSPLVAQSVAGDLGLKTDVLDPLEGITSESRGTDYLTVMRANANSLKVANQCS